MIVEGPVTALPGKGDKEGYQQLGWLVRLLFLGDSGGGGPRWNVCRDAWFSRRPRPRP
jgi:hypothetical protein